MEHGAINPHDLPQFNVYSLQSDEYSELSTTYSDIDSQPRTPGEALNDTLNSSTHYDEDEGVFKLPGEPPKTPKTPRREEFVAKRTRSKISFEATPIDSIQTNVLPDFDACLYDTELDMDEAWQEFLAEFQMPLSEF